MDLYKKIDHYPELFQDDQVCYTCGYYIQHYRCDETHGAFRALGCGHCVLGRVKRREPEQTCEHWRSVRREPNGGDP